MTNVFISADDLRSKMSCKEPPIIFDGSWHMPVTGRNGYQEYKESRIPGAFFFDLDTWSEPKTTFPHTLPSPAHFKRFLETFGIDRDREIVIYESGQMYSAARLWFVLKVFGIKKVSLLECGLAHWSVMGLPVEKGDNEPTAKAWTDGELKVNPAWLMSIKALQAVLNEGEYQLVDARPSPRFNGTVDEPRPGLRRGCVPTARNISFLELSTIEGPISSSALRDKLKSAGIQWDHPITIMCGSGVTACVLFSLLYNYGKHDISLYDGSWSEWGIIEQPLYVG